MSGYEIGVRALDVAQKAIEIIGTNIANVATEGSHRQSPNIEPVEISAARQASIGGSRISSISRNIDMLLESQILGQRPVDGQVSQELLTLRSIEQSLGTLESDGLLGAMGRFFDSLRQLASQPDSQAMQEQAAWAADSLASEFRRLGEVLEDLKSQICQEAETCIAQVNSLNSQVAAMNGQIQTLVGRGDDANLMRDRRDQAIMELAELVDVQLEGQNPQTGVGSVVAWGTPLVVRRTATELEVGITEGGKLGVSVKDASFYQTDVRGGRLGGLLALRNEIVPEILEGLDALAAGIVSGINRIHFQGVGAAGSFTELTGWPVSDQALSDWLGQVPAGSELHVRVIDLNTQSVTRYSVPIDGADTIADVAAGLDALSELRATATGSQLRIEAESGYRFDFLPALAAEPKTSTIPGSPQPAISGIYTGQSNETYTCTVLDTGDVGVASSLRIQIENGAGQTVRTLSVGQGYAAGDRLEVDQGIYVSMPARSLIAGEQFTVEALASSDATGLLAACGINTLFSGNSARTMAVRAEILANPSRFATAMGSDMADNLAVGQMAELESEPMDSLNGTSPTGFHQQLLTGVGQRVMIRQARKDSLTSMMQQLENQRSQFCGVDIKEQPNCWSSNACTRRWPTTSPPSIAQYSP